MKMVKIINPSGKVVEVKESEYPKLIKRVLYKEYKKPAK